MIRHGENSLCCYLTSEFRNQLNCVVFSFTIKMRSRNLITLQRNVSFRTQRWNFQMFCQQGSYQTKYLIFVLLDIKIYHSVQLPYWAGGRTEELLVRKGGNALAGKSKLESRGFESQPRQSIFQRKISVIVKLYSCRGILSRKCISRALPGTFLRPIWNFPEDRLWLRKGIALTSNH